VVCGNTGRLVGSGECVVGPQWDEDAEYCCVTMEGKQKHIDDIFKKGSSEWKGRDDDEVFEEKLREWRDVDCGKVCLESEGFHGETEKLER